MNSKRNSKLGSESGMILMVTTMGVFILLSIFAFYLARFSSIENRTGAYHLLDIKARNLAMTGIERGLMAYKPSRNISDISGNFNNGTYSVSFDSQNDEAGSSLSNNHYLTIKSKGKINVYLFARNAGTSVEQLERFYLKHLDTNDEIVKNLQSFG